MPQGTVLAPLLFISFVNLIDSNLTSKLRKFADDIKLASEIGSDEDKRALQLDLDTLLHWTEEWQMEFNVDKCKVLNLGVNDNCVHNLNGKELLSVREERDLGVLMTNDLKFRRHCQGARKKALKVLGIMNRNVHYKSKDVMRKKNSSLHMSDHTWNIAHKHVTPLSKTTKILERVQREATKMVRGMSRMTYRERLVSLNMFPVHYRRIRGDLILKFLRYIKELIN